MIIGVPKEIKDGELRVALTPVGAETLVAHGHSVLVETCAGLAAGMTDDEYRQAGASILDTMQDVYRQAEMILKVKEILPPEYSLLREDHVLFTYIHSAIRPEETQVLLDRKVVGIAYENVTPDGRDFPLLTPMSEIAGEVGMLMGAYHLFAVQGGSGLLLSGAPGVEPAKVAILGAGHVGLGAARYALGMGADVTLLDIDLARLRTVRQEVFPGVKTLYCVRANVERVLRESDVLVNAVKWSPGLTLVSRDMLKLMKRTALIVDIDCEPNGAVETCRFSTHADPIYEVDGIRHLCVPNLPSAVARTASLSLCNATLPYTLELAEKGWLQAVKDNAALRKGMSFAKGCLTFLPTAEAQNRPYTTPERAIELVEGRHGTGTGISFTSR
ncbi:MAG: alanine dehydrogenase [Thermoguttaceae bacterium]|jgi:alanine dehydrogenase|nr:alanine dehydrogenase [Thermoguttaceae bacterium]